MNEEKIKQAIEEIKPALQADGGDIEYLGLDEEGYVLVRLLGACQGCPMARITRERGVERRIRMYEPDIKGVKNMA
ncbi:MAG: NifU family protein [Planctomycetota bacterium]|nr:MAG: NifU family protein [Planctomycetota bacterium]